ncbi:hypothetical protein [Algoriphagus winogradskyi]|uniref:hypothetical protein n=1 Tax=Algoriphagus winogradskyi TaxID=237017 RepID=UPI0024B8523B|nr:hypothetical protein [Algoriphagus winogradskyi]
MIFSKAIYSIIAFGFLVILTSLLVVPSVIVSAIDEEVDISMVYSFAEEETKEHEVKVSANLDDYIFSSTYLDERTFSELITIKYSNVGYLTAIQHVGIIVPPPEFS